MKMGQYWSSSWTNVSKKPKGFKWIGDNTYEYDVYFSGWIRDENPTIIERLPIKYFIDKKTNFREIDLVETTKSIAKRTGVCCDLNEYYPGLGMFKRDDSMFPFLEYIRLSKKQMEEYLKYWELRQRIIKIKKLKNKM
jgi:hypothetical protein